MKTPVADLVIALIQTGKLPVPPFNSHKPEEWASNVVTMVTKAEKLISEAKPQPEKAVDMAAVNRGLEKMAQGM